MSLNISGLTDDVLTEFFYVEVFLCGSPPITIARSTFEGNEALAGGGIYSVDARTAMEIGNDLGVNGPADERPFTARRMKELYASPNLIIANSHFTDNRATGNNFLEIADLPGIGGGAVFTSGVANVSSSTFTGNGSPADPIDDNDVTLVGGAVAACGYSGTKNVYEENRAIIGGAVGIGVLPFEIFEALCYAGQLPALAAAVHHDGYLGETFRDNFAEEAGGAIWSVARGRSSNARRLVLSGNSEGSAQSVAFSSGSCSSRDSLQLISSWKTAGTYAEGASDDVTCDTNFSPFTAMNGAIRGHGGQMNLGFADALSADPATLFAVQRLVERLIHR
jgi:hypothetical protein